MKKKGFGVRERRARYFKEEELVKLIEEELPSLISKRPELKLKLRALFDDVATKSDIVAVLQEIKNLREDMEKLREDTNRRFEAMREDMDRRFEAFREDMDKRFEEMRIDFKEAIEKTVRALSSKIETVGSRWGIMAENSMRELLNDVVSRVGFTTIKWKKMDEERRFFPIRGMRR